MTTGQIAGPGTGIESAPATRHGAGKTGILVAIAVMLIVALIGIAVSIPSSRKAAEVGRDPSGLLVGSKAAGDVPAPGIVGIDPNAITADEAATAAKNEPYAAKLGDQVNQNRLAVNFVWTLIAGFLVMFMQLGFAFLETGFCRAKNAVHVMGMNIAIYFIGMLGYFCVGFAFQFGGYAAVGSPNLGLLPQMNHELAIHIGNVDWGLIGAKGFFLSDGTYDAAVAVLFLFNMVFMDTAATIPTGAMAERWKWSTFCIYGLFISTIIYPIFGNWAWGGGWLSQLGKVGLGQGYIDFAGSGVVHAVGGFTALAGAYVLGPRIGKYNKDGSSNTIPGHNMVFAIVGTLILAFGWFGFNPGSTLGASGNGSLRIGLIAVATMLASASGALVAMLITWYRNGKPDIAMTCNGLLIGLVAITAPSGWVSPISAVIIGAVAGMLVVFAAEIIDRRLKIDDPVGAVAVHGVGGIWGILAVGLFADGTANYAGTSVRGLFFGDASQLVAQLIGAVVVMLWAGGVSFAFFKLVNKLMGLRVSAADELSGLDLPDFGVPAYWNGSEPLKGGIFPLPTGQGTGSIAAVGAGD